MIQDSATSWIQVPIEERNAPAHSSRKLRWAKAATKPPLGRGSVGGAPLVTYAFFALFLAAAIAARLRSLRAFSRR